MRFMDAMSILLEFEGGYVNDPRDPGGETKYGISKRAYPNEDIANLTMERACDLYKRDYWDLVKADQLPPKVRFAVFDAAVNSGVAQAVKWLQRSAGAQVDGVLGPRTLQKVSETDPMKLAVQFLALRLEFLTELRGFQVYGRGWTKRIVDNLKLL